MDTFLVFLAWAAVSAIFLVLLVSVFKNWVARVVLFLFALGAIVIATVNTAWPPGPAWLIYTAYFAFFTWLAFAKKAPGERSVLVGIIALVFTIVSFIIMVNMFDSEQAGTVWESFATIWEAALTIVKTIVDTLLGAL